MFEIIFLSFIAAVISIDARAFGQFMVYRPIVCGPIFGYLLGDIKSGLWIGMIVELLWISVIPMGAAIPTDSTAVTILTVIWGAKFLPNHNGFLILSLAIAIPAGIIFKKFDILLRYYNIRIAHWIEKGVEAGKEKRIEQGIYLGVLLVILRSFIFFVIAIYIGQLITVSIYNIIPAKVITGLNFAWKVLPIAGMSMILLSFYRSKLPFIK